MANYDGSDFPKLIYNLGRPSGNWQDTYNHVSKEILGRITRLLYRTYFNDDGKPCGFSVKVLEEACFAEGERDTGLPHRDDDNGRVVSVHE